MDIQTRKLVFIQDFLKIQSEELISRFEKVLNDDKESISPFTIKELNSRIDQSLDDSNNDRVTEAHKLLDEIKEWQ